MNYRCSVVLLGVTRRTSTAVVVLVVEVMVEMANHVANRLLSSLRVQCVLDRLRRLNEIVDVDA